jgi:hypothetical protein
MQHDAAMVLVDPDTCAMEHLNNLAVHPSWYYVEIAPDGLTCPGSKTGESDFTFLLAEAAECFQTDLRCNVLFRSVISRNTEDIGDFLEFGYVFYAVARIGILAGQKKGHSNLPAVVGMSGSTGGDHAGEISGHDHFGRGPADTAVTVLATRLDPAWSHVADPTAQTLFSECAMGGLML